MIVRDEESALGPCLASARELCDEIVVVDTGSTDDTVQLAEAAGARVVQFTWCDDFSAARNESVRHARGDWVLVLDADERLGPGGSEKIRDAIAQDDFDCGMLNLHDAARLDATTEQVLSGRERIGDPMMVPRLLRRLGDDPYTGIVHETVRPWLVVHGNRMRHTGADIAHYGAVPSHREALAKRDRNTRLLEKRAKLEPDDFTVHGYLAHEYLGARDEEKAWAAVERGWALVTRASPNTLRSALRLASARALIQFAREDPEGVLDTVRVTTAYEGQQPDLDFFAGRAHEMLANRADGMVRESKLALAAQAYRTCLAQRDRQVGQRYVRGASSWAGATRLATVCLLRGEADQAVAWFERGLTDNDELLEARYGLAEATLEAGEPARAMALIEPWLDDKPDGWLVRAAIADEQGKLDEFKSALAEARKLAQDTRYVAPHRNKQHGTLHCQLLCYLGTPSPADGALGQLASIMAGGVPRATPRAVVAAERRRVVATVRNLLLLGRESMLERLLTTEAERHIPGITGLIRHVVEGLGMSIEDR